MGEKQIQLFWDDGFISSPADIFRLQDRRADLEKKDGLGQRSVDNIITAIEKSRVVKLERLIYGLGIPQIGQATARLLAMNYGTLSKLRLALTSAADKRTTEYHDLQTSITPESHEINIVGITTEYQDHNNSLPHQ